MILTLFCLTLSVILTLCIWLLIRITTKLVTDEVFYQVKKRGFIQRLCHGMLKLAATQHPREDRRLFVENTLPDIEKLFIENRLLAAMGKSISVLWMTNFSLYILWGLLTTSSAIGFAYSINFDEFPIYSSTKKVTILLLTFLVPLTYCWIYYLYFLGKRLSRRYKNRSYKLLKRSFGLYVVIAILIEPVSKLFNKPLYPISYIAMLVTILTFLMAIYLHERIAPPKEQTIKN